MLYPVNETLLFITTDDVIMTSCIYKNL